MGAERSLRQPGAVLPRSARHSARATERRWWRDFDRPSLRHERCADDRSRADRRPAPQSQARHRHHVHRWRHGRGGPFRDQLRIAMDLRFTPEENAFREEVRAFMRASLPEAIRRKMVEGRRLVKEDLVTWQRILNKKGWAVPHWPVEWGGTNWTPVQQYIFRDE